MLLPRALRARHPDTRGEGVGCLKRSEVAEAAQRLEGRPASACAASTTEARATSAASTASTSAASAGSTSAASAPKASASAPAASHLGGHLLVE